MTSPAKYAKLSGSLVMLGFGSIGQAMLPLLFRHIEITPDRVRVISGTEDESQIAQEFGVQFTVHPLTESDYLSVLEPLLNEGDYLLNLSVDVSSLALIRLCWRR